MILFFESRANFNTGTENNTGRNATYKYVLVCTNIHIGYRYMYGKTIACVRKQLHTSLSQITCSVRVYGSSIKKSPYRTPLINVVTPWAIVFRCNVAEPAGRGGYTKRSSVANTKRPPSYSDSSFRGTCMVFNDRSV